MVLSQEEKRNRLNENARQYYYRHKDRLSKQRKEYYQRTKQDRTRKQTCKVLRQHHEEMKHDPERLTTEFMQSIIKVKCNKGA